MGRTITLLCWNFEANGGADATLRKEANRLLASLHPDLLFRQEMWGADAKGKAVMESMEEDLALRGWLGPSSHTGVFASTSLFSPVCGWPDRDEETIWKMPPTVRGLASMPGDQILLDVPVLSSRVQLRGEARATYRAAVARAYREGKHSVGAIASHSCRSAEFVRTILIEAKVPRRRPGRSMRRKAISSYW